MTAAQTSVETTRKTYEMAYGVRDNIRQISAHAGDDSAWMAFPSEGRKTLNSMYETAGPAFDWAVKERPVAEAMLKKLTTCTRWRATRCNEAVQGAGRFRA